MNAKLSVKKFLLVLTFLFALFVVVGCRKDPTLTFEKTSFEVEVGEVVELKPVITDLEDGVVEYSFDKEGIVVDKGNNKFEAAAAGSVTIKASLKGYEKISVDVKVTVKEKVEEHVHEFVNGSCECGELHDCQFVDGKCECGKEEDVVVEPTKGTIAEIAAAEDGLFETTALVVATNAQSFLIKDATGAMLVYKGKTWAADLVAGDKVKVTGNTTVYGGAKQFGTDATYEKVGTETVDHGVAKELSATDCDAYATAATIKPEYVKFSGKLAVSGNYFNVTIEGATIKGSLTYPADAEVVKLLDGKDIEITGYVTGTASKGQYLNIMFTEVVEIEATVVTGTITLTADKLSGKADEQLTITAEVVLDGDGDASVEWTSSDEDVATVDEFGVVTLVGAGTAEITASLVANPEVFATVEVSCAPGLDFIQVEADEEYYINTTEELFFFYEPEDAVAEFVWSSSDESICTVDNGVITTLKGGYVEITVATTDGEFSETVSFRVYNYVTEITLQAEKSMTIESKQRIIATLAPEPYKANAKFQSSDESILFVDGQGMVTAKGVGKATITVTASDGGEASASVEIEVTEPIVDAQVTLADPAVEGINRGSEYTFNGMKFLVGYTAFPTLKQAVEVATETVYVAAGKYADNITIDKSGFSIIGPNSGINPVQATRLPEAEITGKITIGAGLENITIKGLAFTETGCVDTSDSVNGIEISFNNIYDTNTDVDAWAEGRTQTQTNDIRTIP